MAVVRDIEPWDELLQAGREDERLVMQAAQNRRAARAVALPEELHPEVAEALVARGVERLWSHQAEALHAAWAGPTIVTTGTASGKSPAVHVATPRAQLDTLRATCRRQALVIASLSQAAAALRRGALALKAENAELRVASGEAIEVRGDAVEL